MRVPRLPIRDLPGFPGYRVDGRGWLWSYVRGRAARVGKAIDNYGYYVFGYKGKPLRVHQLVALAFHGPCPEGEGVRHLDGNHLNNKPSNLVYGTQYQNIHDAIEHGTHISVTSRLRVAKAWAVWHARRAA